MLNLITCDQTFQVQHNGNTLFHTDKENGEKKITIHVAAGGEGWK